MTRRLAALAAALLLATGCSGLPSGSRADTSSSRSPSSPPTSGSPSAPSSAASPSGTSSPVAVPRAPGRGACYRLSIRTLTRPTNGSPPVSCRGPHTARTIYVGRLDTVVDGHAVAVDSATVQAQLARVCPRKLAGYLGGSASARDLSRFNVVWYSPTLRQSDQGADWFRCDLVAFAGADTLFRLPGRSLRGVLDRPSGLATYGLCGTTAPGARGFQRVICDRRHSWRAIDTIGISGGQRYPGRSAVRRAGDSACKDRVRAQSADTLKFQYGWEWPTSAQWKRGQHYGYCWAPDRGGS
ncbi:MAG: hypothetical protein HOQ45_07950 [Nocardioidaceae bacterium]|nr:hypothetical protein [Nocardioidaceae bacterium]